MEKILIIGACGQIGTELTEGLRAKYGIDNVVASDIKKSAHPVFETGIFETVDAMDKEAVFSLVKKRQITQVYLLAALLSATAEKSPDFAWKLNMDSLFHVLNLAKEGHIKKVYWPSSIAVFGPNTPKVSTPQYTITEPATVYGISKLAGERWCEYYHAKYGVDVRGLRYPGLIGWKSLPGGGTTDYAVHIFHEALKKKEYTCFLKEDTRLPMMYMDDAIKATIAIMEAPSSDIRIRSSYNVAAFSFTPKELAEKIEQRIPGFKISYTPDHRQQIADGWPWVIDDTFAKKDWGWAPSYSLDQMVDVMLENIKKMVA